MQKMMVNSLFRAQKPDEVSVYPGEKVLQTAIVNERSHIRRSIFSYDYRSPRSGMVPTSVSFIF